MKRHKILVRKSEETYLRWEDYIKMDIKDARCEGIDWIQLA
jgi:hypothetical protein